MNTDNTKEEVLEKHCCPEQHFSKYKDAFDLIEQLCEGYRVHFTIKYMVSKITSKYNRMWVVQTMGRSFVSEDPLKAISEAFKLILNANGRGDLLPKNEENEH